LYKLLHNMSRVKLHPTKSNKRELVCLFFPGPAISLLPLIVSRNSCGLQMAVACLTAFMGLQAFAYAGFHAYVQACPVTLSTI